MHVCLDAMHPKQNQTPNSAVYYSGTTTGRPHTMTVCRQGAKECGCVLPRRSAASSACGSCGNARGSTPRARSTTPRITSPGIMRLRSTSMAVGSIECDEAAVPCCSVRDLLRRRAASANQSGTAPDPEALEAEAAPAADPAFGVRPKACRPNSCRTPSNRAALAVCHSGASLARPCFFFGAMMLEPFAWLGNLEHGNNDASKQFSNHDNAKPRETQQPLHGGGLNARLLYQLMCTIL